MRAKQLELGLKFWGGKRKNAGRPNLRGVPAHVARPNFSHSHPLHITLKLRQKLPSLRRKDLFRELRCALMKAQEFGLRINHFNILSNHVHLIAEASDKTVLHQALQSLGIRLAKAVNRLEQRRGSVLKGRYHLHCLKTAREVKNALAYVLANSAKHSAKSIYAAVNVDRFSSLAVFTEFKSLKLRCEPKRMEEVLYAKELAHELVKPPQTWLLKVGWLRAA